jgi:hypothetical protein
VTQPDEEQEGDVFVAYEYDVYYPTFPDTGEKVKPHELDGWLKMITDDESVDEAAKKVACYIVHQVRAQSN